MSVPHGLVRFSCGCLGVVLEVVSSGDMAHALVLHSCESGTDPKDPIDPCCYIDGMIIGPPTADPLSIHSSTIEPVPLAAERAQDLIAAVASLLEAGHAARAFINVMQDKVNGGL